MNDRKIEILGHEIALSEFTNEVAQKFMYYSHDSGLAKLEERQGLLSIELQGSGNSIMRDVALTSTEQLELAKLTKKANKKADEYEALLNSYRDSEDSTEEVENQLLEEAKELDEMRNRIYDLRYQEEKLKEKSVQIRSSVDELNAISEEIKVKCFGFVRTIFIIDTDKLPMPSDYIRAIEWVREGKEYLTYLAKNLEPGNRAQRRAAMNN